MNTNFFLILFSWSRKIVILIFLVSILISLFSYEAVIDNSVTEIFGLLGLLPFVAIAFLLHLIAMTPSLIKKTVSLSFSEINRFKPKIEQKKGDYISAGILNLALGSINIATYLFFGQTTFFTFLFLAASSVAILSVLVSIIEEVYVSSVSSYIQERTQKKERTETLSKERARAQ